MRVITRDEWWRPNTWVPSPPRWTPMGMRQPDVFIHHVGGACPDDLPSLDWINRFEQSALAAGAARGDHYIALEYHVGIFRSGVIYQGRPDRVQGGATLGHNANSYAICLMGDYRTDRVSDAQIDAIRWLLAGWEADGEVVTPPRVQPHSAVYPTACPGDNARARLPEMLAPTQQGDEDVGYSQWNDLEKVALLKDVMNLLVAHDSTGKQIFDTWGTELYDVTKSVKGNPAAPGTRFDQILSRLDAIEGRLSKLGA